MIGRLKRILRFFYNYFRSGNFKIAIVLSKYSIERYKKVYPKMIFINNGVQLVDYDLFIPVSSINILQSDFELIIRVLQFAKISFDNDEMIVSVSFNNHEIRIIVKNYDTLSTVEDIFSLKIYSFNEDTVDDFIVIDIGMNIGIASLYFASFTKVNFVYGYEPFQVNYTLAGRNFDLNPKLSKKIKPFNSGVDSVSKTIFLPNINEGDLGFSTSDFVNNSIKINQKNKVEITITGINEIVNSILINNNKKKIYVKLDCEGAEYEILQALSDSSKINNISIIELEWHYKGPSILIEILKKNNFQVIYTDENINGYTGIIKAEKI